ncbi:hypothetical protein IV494_00030 [Kaistella sp. G5-32]|uniref:Uncharacterized protein n=1 Tax=Kaistella gelatinilytica TaxID=2787636 RepID=A0ABS0F768_9FLAO|nr:hypothetical protein [Kaistella gelatinilytica]MBF8455555.1 hypothetical protein [Kaistella gelatinilytica]
MSNKTPLKIHLELGSGQILNKEIGWLSIPSAGKIKVSILEYYEEKKKNKDQILDLQQKKISLHDDLIKDEKKWSDLANKRFNEGGDWQSFVDENGKKISKAQGNLNANIKQGRADYKKNEAALQAKIDALKSDIKKTAKNYESVRWVWQLIGSDRPNLTKESFNEAIVSGIPEMELSFDDFLEGGGAAYLEPFWDGEIPTGKYPNGIIINCLGKKPQILMADWRDAEDNEITKPVKFGSTVYLNVYSEALYGNNIYVQLLDRDKVVRVLSLGFTNADDKLFASDYLNNEIKVEDREEKDIKETKSQFERAITVHSTKKYPKGAKIGKLVEDDGNNKDKKITLIPNVQKCKFPVFIDPFWKISGGDELEIYPEIENGRIPSGKKTLSTAILQVKDSGILVGENISKSNQVVVLSNVETDMNFFHHCKYTYIDAKFRKDDGHIFDINNPNKRFLKKIDYYVVAGDKKEENYTITFEIPDLKTEDCVFEHDPKKDHAFNAILVADKSKFINLNATNTKISFDVKYPKPSRLEGESMIQEKNVKPLHYALSMNSCAVSLPIDLYVYPDVYYELGFKFMTSNPFYVGQTKSYNERKYMGNWGFFDKRTNKNIRKEQTSQRKKNYKNEKQEVGEGKLKYDNFEAFLEYGYNDVKESNLTIDGENPVLSIIDSTMWIINTLGKLSFDKEADEAKAENDKKRPGQVKDRNKKRNKYLASKGKTLSKIPFKVEIGQPTFAGSVKWHYDQSEKNAGEIGTLYEVNFKADPLISIKGSLDLLFVATKIPYVGQALKAITFAADTVGSSDDFWNEIVDFFGGGDDYKIQIDIDYYLDLFIEGEFKIEATALGFHTIDRFRKGKIEPVAEIKVGIECGGSLTAKFGNIYSLEAQFEGKAEAVWQIKNDEETKKLSCKYQGIYATIKSRVEIDGKRTGNDSRTSNKNKSNPEEKKFLLHDGFSYEFKLD